MVAAEEECIFVLLRVESIFAMPKHGFSASVLISIVYLYNFGMSLCMVFSMNSAIKYLGQTHACQKISYGCMIFKIGTYSLVVKCLKALNFIAFGNLKLIEDK